MMAVAHKGAISFGLVHIPISLYRTTQDNHIAFNQLCKSSKQRVRYKKFCGNCEKELKADDIVKGYQYEKDKYVIMTQAELDAMKTEKDRSIHILQFCDLHDIDDIYYEKKLFHIVLTLLQYQQSLFHVHWHQQLINLSFLYLFQPFLSQFVSQTSLSISHKLFHRRCCLTADSFPLQYCLNCPKNNFPIFQK